MNRRTVLLSLPSGLLAGCVSDSPSTGQQNGPDTSAHTQSEAFSAKIVDVRYDKPHESESPTPPRGDDGNYQQTVSATFDCTTDGAMLEGWLFTSSCRTVSIDSLSYDEDTDRVTLVLYPKWDDPEPPEEVDCAGAKYYYRIRLEAKETLPAEIRTVYQSPDKQNTLEITMANNDC